MNKFWYKYGKFFIKFQFKKKKMNSKNNNLRFNSVKSSTLFAITVAYVQIEKEHIFFSLEDYCEKLLVCQETHYNDLPHHHI